MCFRMYLHLVPIGGQLFHLYLEVFSGYTYHRTLRSAVNSRPPGVASIDNVVNEDLLQKQKMKYCGYLIFHINSVSTRGNLQVFYHTSFLAKYYGLSRRGIHALSQYGYVCKLTLFDEQMQYQLQRAKNKVRYVTIFQILILI